MNVPVTLAVRGGTSEFKIDGHTACGTCGGAGVMESDHICPACGGLGRRPVRRTVTVKIPQEVRDGQTMRLKGLGDPGGEGSAAGDLYLTINVVGDEVFELRGDEANAVLPVAPWEAAFGATVPVRTLHGRVHVKVPPNSTSGGKLRIKGQGLPRPDGSRGDFFVRLELALPADLTPEQLEHLRRLQASGPPPVTGGARAPEAEE